MNEGAQDDFDSDSEDMEDLHQSGLDPIRQSFYNLKKGVTDRSMEVRETLKRFQGKVFHAVSTSQGTLLRYRIGLDGRITLEKRLKGIYVTAEKFQEARQNLVQAGKEVPIKAQRRWRKAVTGDPDKRIRDHMKETPQVKMLDKVSFTLGVIVICLSEWLILRLPNYFSYFYYSTLALLLMYRYYDYSSIKSELYMMDFCYFVNLSVILQTAFYPDNLLWFKANYVLAMGPICIAIVVWRNSLVFHSLDKLTSFFLHAFPTMLCHIWRWRLVDHSLRFQDEFYIGLEAHFGITLAIYAIWQIGYLLMTEVVLKARLDADPEIVTSQRYLAKDSKNSANRLVTKICRKYGYLGPNEEFEPETFLSKIVFVVSQLVYTLVTILHPPLLYKSYYLSCCYLVTVFIMAVWNGASYYIEVFSKRYNLKFVEKSVDRKESLASSAIADDQDHEEFSEEFAEALDDIDIDALLAGHMHDEDAASSTSSKEFNIGCSREASVEPLHKAPAEEPNQDKKNE